MKRTFWFSAGYVFGLGTSVWVQRRVRSAVDTYTPEHVRRRAADRTRELTDLARRTIVDVREAATDGRTAMRQSELELQAEFGARPPARHRVPRPSSGPWPAQTRPRGT